MAGGKKCGTSGALDVDNPNPALGHCLSPSEGVPSTMPDETKPDRSAMPLDVLDRIDRVCDRFEAASDAR